MSLCSSSSDIQSIVFASLCFEVYDICMKCRFKLFLLIYIFCTLTIMPVVSVDILFLGSGVVHLPWSDSIRVGMEQKLDENGIQYSIFEEHLDTGRFGENNQKPIFHQYLSDKYSGSSPDVCVLAGNAASELFHTYGDLFPKAQIISIESIIEAANGTTVINLSDDYSQTIQEMMQAASPDHIYLIGDTTTPSTLNRLEAIASTLDSAQQPYTALTDIELENLISLVENLPEGSAIFFTPITRVNNEGKFLIPLKVLEAIYTYSSVPIFSNTVSLIGSGTIGGYISNPKLLGEAVADVIAGKENESKQIGFGYYYDWNLVKKYGFEKTIHPESILLNKTLTFYELYSLEILFISIFLVIMVLLVISLIIVNRNLTTAKKHINNEKTRLEKMVSGRTQELNKLYLTADKQARIDALTGLQNRRSFFEEGMRVHALSVRNSRPYSLLMLDVDSFKKINDQFGHSTGDKVLRNIAANIRKSMRSSDIPARIGGDEFCLLLQETACSDAIPVAERIRKSIESLVMVVGELPIYSSISIGIACLNESDESIDMVLSRADGAMYQAKKSGKNSVFIVES